MIEVIGKLASQPWLMEPRWFRVAYNILARNDPTLGLDGEFAQKIQKRALSLGDGKKKELRFVERRGSIGVLHIRGPIVRYGGMMELSADVRSLETYAKEFKALEEDPTVSTIVLNIDSPGGEAAGIGQFATYVRNSKKRVVAYVDDLAASAAYWIASAASKIYASPTAFVGSIGVVFTLTDDSEKLKKEGLERIEIVSTVSPRKRPDPKSEEGRSQIQAWADDLAKQFIAAVAKYRGVSEEKVTSDFGQGDIIIAEKAKAAGMIDEIATFEGMLKQLQGGKMDTTQLTADGLKKSQPELYQQIFDAGAEAERKRIEAIENLGNFKGYEEMVKKMKFDGKSSAEDVELAVFRAERARREKIREEFHADGEKAAALLAEVGSVAVENAKPKESNGGVPSVFEKVLANMKGGK